MTDQPFVDHCTAPVDIEQALKKTAQRFERQEARKIERGATYVARAEGKAVCEALLPDLAKFMLSPKAPSKPQGLESIIDEFQVKPEELALAALSLLLHYTAIELRGDDEKSPAMRLKKEMGRTLRKKCFMLGILQENPRDHERIMKSDNRHRAIGRYWKDYHQSNWTDEQYARAGNWLLDCVLQAFPFHFALDDERFPFVTEEGRAFVRGLSAGLVYRDPVFPPAMEPLADWTGLRTGGYWSDTTRISASFVRDSDPETEKAITRAFSDGSMRQHVDGVNVLQRVGWTINARMIPVVERFAGKVGNESQVVQDIATAKDYGAKTFYIPMNCDFRGRVFGVPHFNFQREDHVRALFRFARGMPIGWYGDRWIMIHIANCADGIKGWEGISKRSWPDRIKMVEENIPMIMRIAADPEGTEKEWRKADAPFSFVAGCMELAAARKKGPSFITHLPVCFDGSCSGIQHLAMMMLDEDAGRLVNLIPADLAPEVYQAWKNYVTSGLMTNPGVPQDVLMDLNPGKPQDVYQRITDRVKERLKQDADEYAARLRKDGNDYECVAQAYNKYSLLKKDDKEYRRLKKIYDKCERLKHKMEPDLKKAYNEYKKKKITPKLNKAYDKYKHLKQKIAPENADWWLWVGVTRKLVKRPSMTFSYAVTLFGIVRQLIEVYGEIHAEPRGCPAPTDDAAWYLAKHIDAAAKEILKRPAKAMDFIRDLAKECTDKGKILEWRSPTGFPCANRYFESEVKTLHMELRGEYVHHNVAVGYKTSLDERKCKNGAAPNFVHSLDAAHLVLVANAAAREGIDLAVVHDSFGCLAPCATRMHKIIRNEMAKLYASRDVLDDLRKAAGSSLEVPEKGTLDPRSVQDSTYAFA